MSRQSPIAACVRLQALAFARDGLPLLVAASSAAAIVVGGDGVSPRDVAALVRHDAPVRVGIAVVWALLTRPAVRRQLSPPGAAFVRSAPIARTWQWACCAPFVIAAELPPLALVLAGGDLGQALRLGFASVVMATAARRATSWVASALALLLLALPLAGISATLAGIGLAAASAAVLRGEHAVAGATARRFAVRLRRVPALVHLVLVHAREIGRTRPISLAQAALIVVAGWVWLRRWVAEHARVDLAPVTETAAVVALLSAAPLLGTIGRVHRALVPWIRATATPLRLAVVAAVLVLGAPSLAFAAGVAVTPSMMVRSSAAAGAGLYGLALAAVAFRIDAGVAARRRDARVFHVVLVSVLLAPAVALGRAPMPALVAISMGVALVVLTSREQEATRAEDA